MITRAGLADEIDGFDLMIKSLNEQKSAGYKAYRDQLEDAGMEPRRAAAEVAATKAAIAKRRKLRENPDEAREKDDLIDTILVEIMAKPSRAREATSYAEAKGVETNSPETAHGETSMVLGTGRERPLSIGLHTDGDPEARFESASLHHSQAKASEDNGSTDKDRYEVVTAATGDVSRPSVGGGTDATNSPDGQRAAGNPRFESVHGAREANRPATYGQLVTAGETAPNSHSAVLLPAEQTGADDLLPSVPVANQAGPHLSGVPGGERSTPSLDAGGAKMDEVGASPDRSDDTSGIHHAQSKQAATNSDDVPAFLREPVNERCLNQGACKFARHAQKVTCSDCGSAFMKKRGAAA